MIEKIITDTPHGGTYITIAYLDVNNVPTTKQKASKIVIKEFDKNNNELMETWGSIEPQNVTLLNSAFETIKSNYKYK